MHAPARRPRPAAHLPRGPDHLLGLRLRPLLGHGRHGASERVAARDRDLPGGAPAPAHQALSGRGAPGRRQEPDRRQLPHPRDELGRHQGDGGGGELVRPARPGHGAEVRARHGGGRDRCRPRLHGAASPRRDPEDPRRHVPFHRVHGGRSPLGGADPPPGGSDRGGRLDSPRLHRHRPASRFGTQHRQPRGHAPVPLPGDQRLPRHRGSRDPQGVQHPAAGPGDGARRQRGQRPVPGADRRALRHRPASVRRRPRRPGPGAPRPRSGRAGGRDLAGRGVHPRRPDRPAPGPGRRADAGGRWRPADHGWPGRRRLDVRLPPEHAGREHRGRGADRHAPVPPDAGHGRGRGAPGRPRRAPRLPGVPPARHRDGAGDGALPSGALGSGRRPRRHRGELRRQSRHAACARHRQGRRAPSRARRRGEHLLAQRRRPRRPAAAGPRAGAGRRPRGMPQRGPGARGVRSGAGGRPRGRGGDGPAARDDAGSAPRRVRLRPARAELERRWPPAIQDAAARALDRIPAAVRDWGKHQIYERIQAIAAERRPTPADVDTAWADIRARLSRALGET